MQLNVLGLMSGTSFDAVDAALGEFSLQADTILLRPRGWHSEPIPGPLREQIANCLPPALTSIGAVCKLDTRLGQAFGEAAAKAIAELSPEGVDLIACHGQTVFHWVEGTHCRGTLQLGSPAWIAQRTGTTVISDLRTRDIAEGGQGAPLASMLDALLLLGPGTRRGALNLGGIANITLRDPRSDAVVAFDIGPANALIDAAVTRLSDGRESFDRDGRLAACGQPDTDLLAALRDEPYYLLAPPKSTGKELFNDEYLDSHLAGRQLRPADLVATLTELTAQLVADTAHAYQLDELVVSGGGVRNPQLMRRIRSLTEPLPVKTTADFGLEPQAKEAYLVALLGYLASHGLETTVATATGAQTGSITGCFSPGSGPLRLPEPATCTPARLQVTR